MLVFGFAAFAGVLLAHPRALASRWAWAAGGIALLLFLPNVLWQAAHGWPALEFIHSVQAHRNPSRAPLDFLAQLGLALNPVTGPSASSSACACTTGSSCPSTSASASAGPR